MKISILDRQNTLSPHIRELAERRLLFALSRFGSRIEKVSLAIKDLNGPRGGIDKLCRVTVKMRRLTDISVSCQDAKVEATISRATDRAGRAVSRIVQRSQQIDRRQRHVS